MLFFNRPLLDSMYMPGLHNMLSVYQSTIIAPYHNVFRESDATAAKYLTDVQLAAIASQSPGGSCAFSVCMCVVY